MRFSLSVDAGWIEIVAALAGAGLLIATVIQLRTRPRVLLALRLAAGVLAVFFALKVSLERLSVRQSKPRLAILIDSGLSMSAKDGGGTTRLQRAAAWLASHRAEIEARSEPSLYVGADHARRIGWQELSSIPPSSVSFDFASTLQDVTADGSSSRVWLLSDGVTEDESGVDAALHGVKVPVDSIGVGPAKAMRSVGIGDLKTPDFIFQHSRFAATAEIESSELASGTVIARLFKGATLLSEQRLPVSGDFESLSATFTATAESLGQERYRIDLSAITPAGSGSNGINVCCKSSREFGVEVIRQKHRIMYLAGRPSPEYSQLREQLKSDPNHELVSFVILRNPENVSPVPDQELSLIPFPASEIFVQNLFQFDIFILENFAYWRFNLPVSYLEGLKRFVAQGGALLVIGGSNAFTQGGYRGTPLEEVLPVALWNSQDDFVPGVFKPKVMAPEHPMLRLADTTEASNELWNLLPPLDGVNKFSQVKAGATVLLSHPTEKLPGGGAMPLMVIRDYGKGKVMVLGTDSTWRWKLGGGMQWKTSTFYGRFWSRAVQYLTGTLDLKRVKFSPLPDRLPPREPAVITLHVFDESFRPLSGSQLDIKLMWTPPGGSARAVVAHEREPGIFETDLTGLVEGSHTVRALARYRGQLWGEDQIRFIWQPKPPEVPLKRQWLKNIADSTQADYSDMSRVPVGAWLESLPPLKTEREVVERWHLWTYDFWLWLILATLAAEWLIRRRMGYI